MTPYFKSEEAAQEKGRMEKARVDGLLMHYSNLIGQQEGVARRVLADLDNALRDLDALQQLEDRIYAVGVQESQAVRGALAVEVTSIPTVRDSIERIKKSFIFKSG